MPLFSCLLFASLISQAHAAPPSSPAPPSLAVENWENAENRVARPSALFASSASPQDAAPRRSVPGPVATHDPLLVTMDDPAYVRLHEQWARRLALARAHAKARSRSSQ